MFYFVDANIVTRLRGLQNHFIKEAHYFFIYIAVK